MDGTIIVADDDRTIRTVVSQALTRAGCRVKATATISTLWRWIEEGEGDALITDVMLPDGDALDVVPAIRKKRPDLPIIVMSAQNTVMTAIKATEVGAYEYMPKPFDLKEMLALVSKLTSSQDNIKSKPESEDNLPLIGRSPAMQNVYKIIARLMDVDLNVLITGESGTGKALVSKVIHDFGFRKDGPWVSINFGSIASSDIEKDLFGIEGGTEGKIEKANGGTLYINEIADMPIELQKRFLSFLQEGAIIKMGGVNPTKVDIRVITASRHDLHALVTEGKLREDLLHRLNVVPVNLPPLRERISDIDDLTHYFLRNAVAEGLPKRDIDDDAIAYLKQLSWDGNVREFKNLIQRLTVLSVDDVISEKLVIEEVALRPTSVKAQISAPNAKLGQAVEVHLRRYFDLHEGSLPPAGLYNKILQEIEVPLIKLTLEATQGNQLKAADLLGINRNTLRKKINELDIKVTRSKKMM